MKKISFTLPKLKPRLMAVNKPNMPMKSKRDYSRKPKHKNKEE